jgi:hypothetical protein
MQTSNEQFNQMSQAVRELSHALVQANTDLQRAMRRQRWLVLGVVFLCAFAIYLPKEPRASAFAPATTQSTLQTVQLDPQSREALRTALLEQLPEGQRKRLEAFEQQVKWVSQYMQTWDKGMEGAIVALMLYEIGHSMESVPDMNEQMKVMNSLMNAMPVMATEMQRMNANMSVITANMGVMTQNMDSTMGRMGRSMPWMPW